MADFVRKCGRGEVEEVREALGRGVGVNTRKSDLQLTGLMAAAYGNHEEVVGVLLAQPGVDLNIRAHRDATALHYACQSSSPRVAAVGLRSGG